MRLSKAVLVPTISGLILMLPCFLIGSQMKLCLSIMIMNVFFFRKWKVLQSVQDRNETLFYRSFNIECISLHIFTLHFLCLLILYFIHMFYS